MLFECCSQLRFSSNWMKWSSELGKEGRILMSSMVQTSQSAPPWDFCVQQTRAFGIWLCSDRVRDTSLGSYKDIILQIKLLILMNIFICPVESKLASFACHQFVIQIFVAFVCVKMLKHTHFCGRVDISTWVNNLYILCVYVWYMVGMWC